MRLNISLTLIISDWIWFCTKIKKKKKLVDKSDISGLIDNSDLDKKIPTLVKEAELKSEQDKIAQ